MLSRGCFRLLFATLPPVYYPITLVPYPFNYLAYLSPTTYAAEIMHSTMGYLELSTARLALDWAVLLGVCAVILFVAVKEDTLERRLRANIFCLATFF